VRVPFRLVDVFAQRPLAGNQLCVVSDPDVATGLPTASMQALALEIGFSETTFVTSAERDRYAVRIFTPGAEMPFAGHPTLGTAFVLVSDGQVTPHVTQVTAAGEVRVEVDPARNVARMHQLPPTFGPLVEDLDGVARAVGLSPADLAEGLRPQAVSTGLAHLIVAARDEEAVRRARPSPAALNDVLRDAGADGFYLFASRGDRALARMFAPDVGVIEDPATGSAAGPLGAYLAEHDRLSSGHLTISQGEQVGRPSTLLVDVERAGPTWRVTVGGGVFLVGEGAFDVEL
jgi:trans-2,3-dihydro-3-hydroxyanthranilate isomerase